jgi:hypothetical protein
LIEKVVALTLVPQQYGMSPYQLNVLPTQTRVVDAWRQSHDTPPFTYFRIGSDYDPEHYVLGVRREFLEELRAVVGWRTHYRAVEMWFGEGVAWSVVDEWVRVFEGMFYVLDNTPNTSTPITPTSVVGRVDLGLLFASSRAATAFRQLWGLGQQLSKQFLATRNKLVGEWMSDVKGKQTKEWFGRYIVAN